MRVLDNTMKIPKTASDYKLGQAEFNAKEGDRVRIIRKADDYEGGWNNNWNREMTYSIGHTLTVVSILGNSGILLSPGGFAYPYFVLEKV